MIQIISHDARCSRETEGRCSKTPITAESGDVEWGERRFKVCYRISRGTSLAVGALELLAWALVGGEGRVRSAAIDP